MHISVFGRCSCIWYKGNAEDYRESCQIQRSICGKRSARSPCPVVCVGSPLCSITASKLSFASLYKSPLLDVQFCFSYFHSCCCGTVAQPKPSPVIVREVPVASAPASSSAPRPDDSSVFVQRIRQLEKRLNDFVPGA